MNEPELSDNMGVGNIWICYDPIGNMTECVAFQNFEDANDFCNRSGYIIESLSIYSGRYPWRLSESDQAVTDLVQKYPDLVYGGELFASYKVIYFKPVTFSNEDVLSIPEVVEFINSNPYSLELNSRTGELECLKVFFRDVK